MSKKQNKKLLTIADFRKSRSKSSQLTKFSFRFDGLLLSLPIDSKRRIGNAVLKSEAFKLVIRKSIPKPHIVWIAATNHHVCLCDSKSRGIKFLPETGNFYIFV